MAKRRSDDLDREFTAEVYRTAADERVATLESLYRCGFFALAIYTAGVAVESIFRAYRCKIDSAFDSRHNLHELAKAAKFFEIVPIERVRESRIALSDLAVRWSNNHRYRSDAAIRTFLRRAKLNRGIRGDFLKENARLAIEAAAAVIEIGLAQWTR